MGNNMKKLTGANSSPRIDISSEDVDKYFESETFKRSGCIQLEKFKSLLCPQLDKYVIH